MSALPDANKLPPSVKALGIDPTRIQFNRVLREAYQQQQVRLAEQQRQEEAARAKQNSTVYARRSNPNVFFDEKTGQYEFIVQPTYDDPTGSRAVSKSDVNPDYFKTDTGKELSKQFDELQSQAETQQDFQIYKSLENQGVNPGQLTITRDASGNITSGSGSKNNLTLTVNPDKNIVFSYTQPASQIAPKPVSDNRTDAQIIQELAANARLRGGDLAGYAISRDAAGNLTNYGGTMTKPVSVSGDVALGYAAFKANQIIQAVNTGQHPQYTLTQSDVAKLEKAGVSNAQEIADLKPRFNYSVQLNDKVGVNEAISGPPMSYYYDPTMPFAVTTNPGPTSVKLDTNPVPGAQRFTLPGGFSENFFNYFGNIPKSVEGIADTALHKEAPTLAPEVEGQAYSGLLNLGMRAYQGTPANINLLLFSKDMGDIGLAIKENPVGAAGSLAGTALFTGLTVGYGKIADAAKLGANFLGAASKAEKVAQQAAKTISGIDDATVQAFKVSKTGQEIPLARMGPIYTETRQVTLPAIFRSSVKGLPDTPINLKFPAEFSPGPIKFDITVPAIPDLFRISKGTEDLGLFSLSSGKGQIFQSGLTEAEKLALVTGKGAPATAITDIYKNEAGVLPRVSVPVVVGPLEKEAGSVVVQADRFSGKVAESRYTGANLAEFSTKQMIQMADLAARRNAQISAASAALMEISGKAKPFTPLDFGPKATPKIAQGSRTALETINEMSFDRDLSKFAANSVSKADTVVNNAEKALGLYGGATTFRNVSTLGFGGKTGGESKVNTSDVYDEMLGTGPIPASASKPTTKNQLVNSQTTKTDTRQFLQDMTGQVGRQGSKQGGLTFTDFMLNGGTDLAQNPGLDVTNIPFSEVTQITTPLETPIQTPIIDVPTVTIPTTKSPPEKQFRPPPPIGGTKTKKGKKGNPFSIYYGETLWNVPNIFKVNEKALRKLGVIGSIGKRTRK